MEPVVAGVELVDAGEVLKTYSAVSLVVRQHADVIDQILGHVLATAVALVPVIQEEVGAESVVYFSATRQRDEFKSTDFCETVHA